MQWKMPAAVIVCLMMFLNWPVTCARGADAPAAGARIVIDVNKNPRIVNYLLGRLSNAELVSVVRNTDNPKYKPIYQAILTRKGLEMKYRQEAVDALAKIDHDSPALELLDALAAVDPADKSTARELVGMLLTQPPAELTSQKQKLSDLAASSSNAVVKQAAYAALATALSNPEAVWALASKNPGGIPVLLSALPWINNAQVRMGFYPKVLPLVAKAPDAATQIAAIDAISAIPSHEPETFKLLAQLIADGKGPQRDAAVRSISRIPASKWPADAIAPLAAKVLDLIRQTPGDARTQPAALQAVQLGEDLAAALPKAQGAAIRKQLRAMAVRVILIRTLREQLEYDTRYFAVQAGKPVEIILENDDSMPHNIVIGAPGSLGQIGSAASVMQPPTDPAAKAFIPKLPQVLHAMHLVQPDESGTLSFIAPAAPGQYVYLCTFPGHWPKMYGTMLVVPDLEAWEAHPVAPTDPFTQQPYTNRKNEFHLLAGEAAGGGHAH